MGLSRSFCKLLQQISQKPQERAHASVLNERLLSIPCGAWSDPGSAGVLQTRWKTYSSVFGSLCLLMNPARAHWTTHPLMRAEWGCFQAQPGMKWKPCYFSWTSGLHARRLWQRQNSYRLLFSLCFSVYILSPVQQMRGWAKDMRWANTHHVVTGITYYNKCAYVCVCYRQCLGLVRPLGVIFNM